jgi:hypothetical protein
MPPIRRQIFLHNGRVQIEYPRLMTDAELADVLAVFVEQVRRSKVRPAVTEPKVAAAPKRDKPEK